MINDFVYTIKYPNFDGRIITKEHILYNEQVIPISALWDTGSTYTCISKELIQRLDLNMSEESDLNTSFGKTKSNRFRIEIILNNDLAIPVNALTHDYIHQAGIDVLIGMDIINQGDFAMSKFEGVTCVSFRIPSKGFIDFAN